MSNVLPSLSSWENLFIGLVTHLVDSPFFKTALDNVAGIDAETFREVLLTTDENGVTQLGYLVNVVKDFVVKDGEKKSAVSQEFKVDGIDSNIATLTRIVLLALRGMKSACLGGFVVTFISLLVLYLNIGLFVANVVRLGKFQHAALLKVFDPENGFVPSLRTKEDVKNGNIASREAAETFSIADMLSILSRPPTRAETLMLNELSTSDENHTKKAVNNFLMIHEIEKDAELTVEQLHEFVRYLNLGKGGKEMKPKELIGAIQFIMEVADEDRSGSIDSEELFDAAVAYRHWCKKRHIQIYIAEAIQ